MIDLEIVSRRLAGDFRSSARLPVTAGMRTAQVGIWSRSSSRASARGCGRSRPWKASTSIVGTGRPSSETGRGPRVFAISGLAAAAASLAVGMALIQTGLGFLFRRPGPSQRRNLSLASTLRRGRAGFPATTVSGPTDRVTIDPAPTTA